MKDKKTKKVMEKFISRFAEAVHYKIIRDIRLYGICVMRAGDTDDLDEIVRIRKRLDCIQGGKLWTRTILEEYYGYLEKLTKIGSYFKQQLNIRNTDIKRLIIKFYDITKMLDKPMVDKLDLPIFPNVIINKK